jgi:predicted amidohydrolase
LIGYLYEKEELIRFAEPLSGKTNTQLSALAREYGVYLCCGFLEATNKGIFNSAAIIDKSGRIIHVQRKVSEKPPFANGSEVLSVSTPFGKIAILICGDLFDDLTIEKMDKPVDLLLVPMSRSFDLKSPDQNRWLKEERSAYLEAVKRAGCLTVLVNALESDVDEGSFGGALVVNEEGHLLAESPHGTDRLLIYDY